MAKHHRHATDAAQLVPDAHDVEPVVGEHFAARHLFADAIDENFRAAAGNAAEAGGFEALEHRADRQLVDFGKGVEFRRAKGM